MTNEGPGLSKRNAKTIQQIKNDGNFKVGEINLIYVGPAGIILKHDIFIKLFTLHVKRFLWVPVTNLLILWHNISKFVFILNWQICVDPNTCLIILCIIKQIDATNGMWNYGFEARFDFDVVESGRTSYWTHIVFNFDLTWTIKKPFFNSRYRLKKKKNI